MVLPQIITLSRKVWTLFSFNPDSASLLPTLLWHLSLSSFNPPLPPPPPPHSHFGSPAHKSFALPTATYVLVAPLPSRGHTKVIPSNDARSSRSGGECRRERKWYRRLSNIKFTTKVPGDDIQKGVITILSAPLTGSSYQISRLSTKSETAAYGKSEYPLPSTHGLSRYSVPFQLGTANLQFHTLLLLPLC